LLSDPPNHQFSELVYSVMVWSVFSEENFKKVVENAPIGILIIDRNLKWKFLNERFCEITGYSRKELAGKTFIDITHPEDVERNLALYNKLLSGEVNEYVYEKRYVRKTGEIIWARLAVSAVRINNTYSHMVVSVEDIDASKKNQHMLEMRNEELDTLLYKASHDLKAPVSTLAGLCNLLLMEHEQLRGSALFRHLEETVRRLRNQNESLLELTRIWEGNADLHRISLTALLSSIREDMNLDEVTLSVEACNVEFATDSGLLRIALQRILENAVTFSQPGRDLRIRVIHDSLPGQHRIAVRDNGQGIPENEHEHIMSFFYRASTRSHGSGLGLYIASKAVEKLRGVIRVESVVGEGSSFIIYLPV
jgi:PAS domain S-box-containing protein